MRKDIEIHINTGDINLEKQNFFKLRDFRWVNHDGLSRYIYGEVDIPSAVSESSIRNKGFYVRIPYTPKYKEFMIRVRRVYEDGTFVYLQNPKDGTEWFLVQAHLYGQSRGIIRASELYLISESSYYMAFADCTIDGAAKTIIDIYSSSQSDFNIITADRQNANCMLACVPTNNYRYPLTGVGLIRWNNSSHMNDGSLAETVQREFAEDGVTVINAAYNYDTQQLEMDLDVSNT